MSSFTDMRGSFRKGYYLILCFACMSYLSYGQATKTTAIDSFEVMFNKALEAYEAYDYPTALQEAIALLELAQKEENLQYTFRAYNLMGYVQNSSKDIKKSIVSQEKALVAAKKSKVDSLISWALNDLGNIYSESAEYKKGIGYYEEAIEVNRRANLKEEEDLIPLMNIGWTYLDHNDHENAYPYILKARMYANSINHSPLLYANLDILFGRYYLLNGNYNIAEKELNEVLVLAEEREYLDQAYDATKFLSQLYEKQDRYKEALVVTKRNSELEKKKYDRNKIQELEEANAKFEVAQYKKESELSKIQKEYTENSLRNSEIIIALSTITAIMLLGTLLILWRQYRLRKDVAASLKEKNEELVIAKNEAERLSRLKTQFFSTVSHELRTPLYGITGISSILLEDKEIQSHRDDLESLKFSADYLMTLINDVLVLNKMDANGIRLQSAPFDIRNLIQGIAKSFEFLKQQNNNTLKIQIEDTVPTILLGDSIRLSQILLNLVGNAIKFNENKNVWVKVNLKKEVQESQAYLEFIVKDDGIGISLFDQETIFDEFKQANNRNYGYQGTGLGLPIVQKLIALFGETIKLKSALNEGATFTFCLNFGVPEIQELNNTIKEIDHLTLLKDIENIHILVVDDNRINQKITQKVLENRNFECTMADNGAEAVSLVQKNQYDLILMDINMPVLNGIDATKAIRKFNTNTPIIALTAVEVEEMRKTIINSGMNDIILKPYDMRDFHSIILRNLQREQQGI